jgi:hypothetical protein
LLRQITKADVDGSATLDLVASFMEFGGLFAIEASCSEPAPSSGNTAGDATAAFDFFFVMLNKLKNVF